jgi:hypothetical protein
MIIKETEYYGIKTKSIATEGTECTQKTAVIVGCLANNFPVKKNCWSGNQKRQEKQCTFCAFCGK